MRPVLNSCGFPGAGFHLTPTSASACSSLAACCLCIMKGRVLLTSLLPPSLTSAWIDRDYALPSWQPRPPKLKMRTFSPKGCTREHFTKLCGTKLSLVGTQVEHCSSQNCFAWTLLSSRKLKKKTRKQSFLDMFLKSVWSLKWHIFLIVVMFYSLPVRKPVIALETCNNLDLSIFVRNWIICHLSEPKSCWFLAICT